MCLTNDEGKSPREIALSVCREFEECILAMKKSKEEPRRPFDLNTGLRMTYFIKKEIARRIPATAEGQPA
jgi:hypothetical protein